MTRYAPSSKRRYALPFTGKVSRIVESLSKWPLVTGEPDLQEAASSVLEVSEEAVKRLIHAWQERTSYLPSELISDPAWGMLLELLQAEIQGRRVSLARLCRVSAVPTSSAVRWLKALERRGLIVRRTNTVDADNETVELSHKGSCTLRRYFREIAKSNQPSEDRF